MDAEQIFRRNLVFVIKKMKETFRFYIDRCRRFEAIVKAERDATSDKAKLDSFDVMLGAHLENKKGCFRSIQGEIAEREKSYKDFKEVMADVAGKPVKHKVNRLPTLEEVELFEEALSISEDKRRKRFTEMFDVYEIKLLKEGIDALIELKERDFNQAEFDAYLKENGHHLKEPK